MKINSVSFTGVIPVNVYNNDLRVYNEKFLRSACQKATKVLAGPIQPENYDLAKDLEKLDDFYTFNDALQGYCKKWRDFRTGEIMSEVPSDYFKIVFDVKGNPYIITGKESFHLATLGKALGIEKKKCRDAGVRESKDLVELQRYYNGYVNSLLLDKSKRLKENMHLGIDITSKGKKNSKLESIFLIQG